MSLIEWQDDFALGIDSVDHEHRTLIELINSLHNCLSDNTDKVEIERVFGEIESAIAAHFALEEKAMRDLAYDQYAEHKTDHELLLDDIRDIADAYVEGAYAELSTLLSEHLKLWFSDHFRIMDSRLHSFLEKHSS
jgi:hemerythrin